MKKIRKASETKMFKQASQQLQESQKEKAEKITTENKSGEKYSSKIQMFNKLQAG